MKRSHALALSGALLFLAFAAPSQAQAIRTGQQCVPAVADASMYRNCHRRVVGGQEMCRCEIGPQALRRSDRMARQDQDSIATGSIGAPASNPGISGQASGAMDTVAGSGLAAGNAGSIGGLGASGAVSGAANRSSGGAVADSRGSGRGNNGHGNDPDGNDASNPGGSNNGDGTDADGPAGNGGGRGGPGGHGNGGRGGNGGGGRL